LRVDYLGEKEVLADVPATLRLDAFAGHAGTNNLGQAVNVERVDVQAALELSPHGLGPGLGSKHPDSKLDRRAAHALGLQILGDIQGVRRRAAEHSRAEVLHQQHLPRGHPTGYWNDGAANLLGAIVESQPTSKEAVAIRIVE